MRHLELLKHIVQQVRRCSAMGVKVLANKDNYRTVVDPIANRNLKRLAHDLIGRLADAEGISDQILREYIPIELGRNPRRRSKYARRKLKIRRYHRRRQRR